ncbi:MAG: fibronectin type III domain-containing protein [Spirochaetaceae bacterium]|nr:fibronectin type III domain-containing protein [Spirochaetaceae bacterium]
MTIFILVELLSMSCKNPTMNGSIEKDTTAPAEVTHLSASANDSQITLQWTNPDDLDFNHCLISYREDSQWIDSPEQFSHEIGVIQDLENQRGYQFLIRTVDNSGNFSEGITIGATPQIPLYAEEVTNLTAEPGHNAIVLRWSNPTKNDFHSCEILYGIDSEYSIYHGDINPLGTTIENLINDQQYNFTILCVNNQGLKSPGISISEAPRDMRPPKEVVNLEIISSDGEVTLSWENPSDEDFHHCEISYILEDEPVLLTDNLSPQGTQITGLTNYTTYVFNIKTVDEKGNKSPGLEISGMSRDLTACGEVNNLTANAGEYEIELTWDAFDEPDFDHYIIQYGIGAMEYTFTGDVSPDGTVIDNLEINAVYSIMIQTVDTFGNISTGVTVSATTRDLTATEEVQNLQAMGGDHHVILQWENPADSDFDHTIIYYGIASPDILFTGSVDNGGTEFNSLENNNLYYFKVVSQDQAGNISQGITIAATPVDLIAPSDITSFTTTAGNEQIILSWVNPPEDDFSHCLLSISTAGGDFTAYTGELNPLGTVISNLEYNINYEFLIQTVDKDGNISQGMESNDIPIDTIPPGAPVLSGEGISEDFTPTINWTLHEDTMSYSYHWDLDDWRDSDNLSVTHNTAYNGLPLGEHSFYMKAIDRAGNSSEISEIKINIILQSPYGLTVTPRSHKELYLQWACDTSWGSGFLIERDSGDGFIEIDTTSISYQYFSDNTCEKDTSCSYNQFSWSKFPHRSDKCNHSITFRRTAFQFNQ